MAISDWPEDQRPREKLITRGAEALTDAELLAIFLRVGVKGKSAVELAQDLLEDFGSLRALLNADRTSFCSRHGLGDAKFVQLQAVLAMAKRHLEQEIREPLELADPQQTMDYLKLLLRDEPQEIFMAVFLDNRHRVIISEQLAKGTIDGAAVYPREVVKAALKHNAAAVIFAHNHPSGVAEPSSADQTITARLKAALKTVDIRVLDHIVIGHGKPVSFAARGMI